MSECMELVVYGAVVGIVGPQQVACRVMRCEPTEGIVKSNQVVMFEAI
jgi:hypothetical protein